MNRLQAWVDEDPDEWRRSASEWRRLGFAKYADYLERYANGEREPTLKFVPRPF